VGEENRKGGGEKARKVEKDEDEETLRRLVPRKFWKWRKVFGKRESERMLVWKTWDHAIELKEGFTPKKEKVYSLSREEREEVCYENPKPEKVSHAFKHLMQNLKAYNGVGV